MKKRKKLRKKRFIFLIIIIFCLVSVGTVFGISYFKSDNNVKEKTENKEETKTPEEEEEVIIPEVQTVNLKSKSRPFAVMINNLGAARPYHTGLQEAYLVYEIVVEGGITRYLALFKDKYPEEVGSVRSARHYYLDYVLENDAYYVHWGWSPQAQKDISSLKINNFNGLSISSPYFYRKKLNVSSEHTGYANLLKMKELVEQKNIRTEANQGLLLKYSATNIDLNSHEPKDALKVDVKYSSGFTTNYVYDEAGNVYKQYVNNKEHVDYNTKEQYTVKNIIIYQVDNKTIAGDDKGRQDLDNIGTGDGYFVTAGKVVPIKWEKKSRSSQTVYRYLDGTEITVNDGNTWIHIVPKNGNISIS